MFDCILFEDDMCAGKTISLSNQWKDNVRYHQLYEWHKFNGSNIQTKMVESECSVPLAWRLYNEKVFKIKASYIRCFFG